jgi:hypothetical protein
VPFEEYCVAIHHVPHHYSDTALHERTISCE